MPRPDRSRTALVDAAALLFRRQGYAATGVNQILETAAVKAGSLYHHFPGGKQQLAAAVVDSAGADIEARLRQFLGSGLPVVDIVDGWIDLMSSGLAVDRRDGCPIEPIATESVNASPLVREASARAFQAWRQAITDRLRHDGWDEAESDETALAVIALLEGALILSRIAGDSAALDAAKAGTRTLLTRNLCTK
jgi:TetR/AcrR family transcriptional regulator, lmrAB and yxaGH operons repressor